MAVLGSISRRRFLQITGVAAGGVVVAVALKRDALLSRLASAEDGALAPDAFVQVTEAGDAIVWVSRSEMGQGVRTGLPMIVAEELDIPWDNVSIRQADAAADGRYGQQLTGGSLSVRQMYDPLRRAGAAIRQMLVEAAAQRWGVKASECATRAGVVSHAKSGKSASYAELAKDAAARPVPDPRKVTLKDPESFSLLGTSVPRVDGPALVSGEARFGMDTRVPGMVYAAVARCPVRDGRLKRYDDSKTMRVPGVLKTVKVDGHDDYPYVAAGVAVIAQSTWAAFEGVRRLEVEWDEGKWAAESSETLQRRMTELAAKNGEIIHDAGDVEGALAGAAKTVEATYEVPFISHAPMEPMNCIVHVRGKEVEIWSPTQNPRETQEVVATYLSIPKESVTVHVTLMGGGFGRRLANDFELEAAMIAKQLDTPVQVVWTREDDIRHDRFRPASMHVMRGGVDAGGMPVAWFWHILCTYPGRWDRTDFPVYAVPNQQVQYTGVPWLMLRGAWRSTVNSYNPWVVQSFLDELAAAGGRDPLELRLAMLRGEKRPRKDESGYNAARMIAVVEEAARKAGWDHPLGPGRGRGIAFKYGYDSYCAEVAEVTVENGRARLDRVVCAVDCGQVINSDMVESQIEGAITFGLSAALKQQITVANGRVQQGNFDDYELITIDEVPKIEAHIVRNHHTPGGMGEVPLPPSAPAVTNAVFAATGKPVRRLPALDVTL